MCDTCDDSRFEVIEKYKQKLLDATNIGDSPEEMAVIDNILFRFWQMGWLAKLELFGNPKQLDTVSRQAALDALEKIDCSDGVGISSLKCDAVDDAVTAIKALPSAQPTDEDIQKMQDIEQAALEKAYECGKQDAVQWVSCEERLPEPGVNVLVDVLDIPADDRFPLVDKIGDDGDWCNCYGEWLAVAWVPIPDPWEGENDG